MFKRILDLKKTLSRKSLFLLGPRQTGKSTLLKTLYPDSLYINLLNNRDFQRYSQKPDHLTEVIAAHKEKSKDRIVIIDEIQKLPILLDEVHNLIESDKSLRFILTGSSARKLRRQGVNLLGGRAARFHLHPICYPELEKKTLKNWLEKLTIGGLPSILQSTEPQADLKDYVGLYLREEIQAEGLSRSIENFSRFLDFAALMNTEQINYTAIGSDAQLSPTTVRDYFEVLDDTLIGHTLPAFLSTKKRKAMATSKFYFFDCGVVNAIIGRSEVALHTPEFGKMLEQAIFIEIKTYLDYQNSTKKIEYWRSTSQFEVDFLIYDHLKKVVAIEVKASPNPGKKDFKGLLALEEEVELERKIVVCNTDTARKTKEGVEIMPILDFLERLWTGKLF